MQNVLEETTTTVDIQFQGPPLMIPNAASTAESIIHKALEYCITKVRVAGVQTVIERLKQHDKTMCNYCYYSVAKQVAETMGVLDANIKSVHLLDYDATPEDICFADAARHPLIHLIVWTEPKTSALTALAESLDRALAHSYANQISGRQLKHLLDVQLVDDADVQNRAGYGASFHSLYHRPLKIWER